MEYQLTAFRPGPDGAERELHVRGEGKFRALAAFAAWARPRMVGGWEPPADDPTDVELWLAPVQFALGRPRLLLELAYRDTSEIVDDHPSRPVMPQRWRVTVAGVRGAIEAVRDFPDDADGVEAALRCLSEYLLEDEGPAWGG